jgi:dephospho-CoA kinase
MKLIVTVGMPGSGKDELVKIAQELGLSVVKMGDLVRDETRRRGYPLNGPSIARVANEEREKHGPSIWAKRAVPLIGETRVLVDGCRGDQEVNVFRHHFGDLTVVAIFASPETRFERLNRRGRGDDGMDLEAFTERDLRELRWGIGNAFALADRMLVNEGSLEEFRRTARDLLRSILAKEEE